MGLTAKQIGYGWKLLRASGFEEVEDKEDYIEELTDGRTKSLRELTYSEFNDMVNHLDKERIAKREKMVNKVLSLAHEMLWELPDGKVDMERVNNFCMKRTPQKVKLDEVKYKDLPTVVSIFEKMHMEFLKAL